MKDPAVPSPSLTRTASNHKWWALGNCRCGVGDDRFWGKGTGMDMCSPYWDIARVPKGSTATSSSLTTTSDLFWWAIATIALRGIYKPPLFFTKQYVQVITKFTTGMTGSYTNAHYCTISTNCSRHASQGVVNWTNLEFVTHHGHQWTSQKHEKKAPSGPHCFFTYSKNQVKYKFTCLNFNIITTHGKIWVKSGWNLLIKKFLRILPEFYHELLLY